MTQLKELSPDKQQRVLWLHHKAFGGKTACTTCEGACCAQCNHSRGYVGWGMSNEEWEVFAEKHHFDKEKGFQTDKGCSLPMTERSMTCLGFMCGGVRYTPEGFPRGRFEPKETLVFSGAQRAAAGEIWTINHA
jgi:hypothetical protein